MSFYNVDQMIATLDEFSEQTGKKELKWQDWFTFVKMLVYRRDSILNLEFCKYYLLVMSNLSLQEYDQLGKRSLNKVLAYLERNNKSIKNSVSLNNMDQL